MNDVANPESLSIENFIRTALAEDGIDHSSLACIPTSAEGRARLLVKAEGVLAGVELAQKIFEAVDPQLEIDIHLKNGSWVRPGDIAFYVRGSKQAILKAERVVLNAMQRMSGIATETSKYVKAIEGTGARVLDTRKTTPLFRRWEKRAVVIGGGMNHRMGLSDMIMLKDNHVDYAGGVTQAISSTQDYLSRNGLELKVEIEIRNLEELKQVLDCGGVDRIMFDNFEPSQIVEGLKMVDGKYETEASGEIKLDTIRSYADTGVDFISVGSLTHSYQSLDLSLKAVKL